MRISVAVCLCVVKGPPPSQTDMASEECGVPNAKAHVVECLVKAASIPVPAEEGQVGVEVQVPSQTPLWSLSLFRP